MNYIKFSFKLSVDEEVQLVYVLVTCELLEYKYQNLLKNFQSIQYLPKPPPPFLPKKLLNYIN